MTTKNFPTSYSRSVFNQLIRQAPTELQPEYTRLMNAIVFKEDMNSYLAEDETEEAILSTLKSNSQVKSYVYPGVTEIANGEMTDSIWCGEFSYGFFTAAATSGAFQIMTLPKRCHVHSGIIYVITQGVQAGEAPTFSIGFDGAYDQIIESVDALADAGKWISQDTDTAGNTYGEDSYCSYITAYDSVTPVYLYVSSGANLSTFTAGKWRVYIKYSVLP